MLVTSDARRGAEVFGRRLVDGLLRRGWDAQLVCLTGGAEEAVEGVKLAPRGTPWPLVIRSLRRYLLRRRPQVVFANGGATLRQGVLATVGMRAAPPVVYGSIGEPSYWLRGGLHRWVQRLLIGRCAHVTAVSEATRRGLMEVLGVTSDRITVIHPGVDAEAFTPTAGSDPGEPLRVLFAGSLSAEKDPAVAVEAARRMGGKVVLRLVGDGPLRSELESGAPDNVEVVGPADDMGVEYEWADVLLLPSRTEGLPGVAVEAAAAGVPTIASRVGGTDEIVADGASGFLVAAGDVDAFVDRLEVMAADRDLVRRFGEEARRRAVSDFALEASIDAFARVFAEVAR